MKELASLHDKHLNRPTLDDSSEEERAIEITTQEITQVQTAFSSHLRFDVSVTHRGEAGLSFEHSFSLAFSLEMSQESWALCSVLRSLYLL